MTVPSQAVLDAAASAYDTRLVPALFQTWASRLADAADVAAGQSLLDVACGTGVVAREAATRTGSAGLVAGLDINPGMLRVATRAAPEIAWRQGRAEALPYDDGHFHAVACQFGLMFFEDQGGALREMIRVLRPGGSLAVAVFDSLASNQAYAAMADAFEAVAGEAVAEMLKAPFALGDRRHLASLFDSAGIPDAEIITSQQTARFASTRDMVLSDVEGWFPLAGIDLDAAAIEAVVGLAETALAQYRTATGAVAIPVTAHIVTARKT